MKNNGNALPKGVPMHGKKMNFGALKRVIKMLYGYYPKLFPLAIACIIFAAITAALPAIFQQQVIAAIEDWYLTADWDSASKVIIPKVAILGGFYVLSLVAGIFQTQIMAIMTQGFLGNMRKTMFNGMQNLPIKYFDTHKHGDIMSHYTNDIDALRQLVSQAIPSLLQASIVIISVFSIMMWYSIWMTLVVLIGVAVMTFVSKTIAGGSAKYFIRQQKAMGKTEGFIQEMMTGQKVVKVFNRENHAKKDFDEVNNALYEDSKRAHSYANCLGPINMNLGNILYVVVATVGGLFLLSGLKNISFAGLISEKDFFGLAFNISIIVPFLNMTKQFSGNINQVSQQINAIVMGLAGAERVFSVMDEMAESDEGYVTLVNAVEEDGVLKESEQRTGIWAWKHPHGDGTVTYTKVEGDVRLHDVDFGYTDEKIVLHNIDIYAEPGQKIAFVGATGAGKTTITNLINRFYDIADGKIRYDGINFN